MLKSKRATWERVFDWILGVGLVVPAAITLALASVCTLENDVQGTCIISALEPFFTFMMSLLIFIAMLGGLIYYPAILFSYIGGTVCKISAWRSEGRAAISRNPIGWGIWAISTVIFLGIAILAIVASIIG
jgi:hypothetical protein